jgi:pentatricopeptide repeat protein
MYAKLNRPEDALKVYDLAKGLGLQCTVTTYGVLIKALMKSGKKKLEEASYEILNSLPAMGITPGVEVYNQFFEHYSKTHNFRQTKSILRLMSASSPKVKPDSVSYGYLINCFADSKKPRSAIAAFHQMTKRRIPPNAYTYMGVLKALSHMRDGLSAVQVLSEMKERSITPDKRHYAMAMFTCVTAKQYKVAEFIFSSYVRSSGEKPDTALYTLLLRSYLQQDKWAEGNKLFLQMVEGDKDIARANSQTISTMLQFQVCYTATEQVIQSTHY